MVVQFLVVIVVVLAARIVEAQSAQPVVWTNLADAITTGANNNGLQKNAGCDGCPAGGNSQQTIAAGDGYVEFTATETNTNRFVGLSTVATHDYSQIHWAIKLGSAIAEIREDNIYKTEISYTTGDVSRVAVVSGQVKYTKNGTTTIWTSATAPSYPLYADASILNLSGSFSNAMIGGSGSGLPTPWTNQDIGTVGIAGGATYS